MLAENERITHRYENGTAYIKSQYADYDFVYASNWLAKYEDTGLSPSDITAMQTELQQYKELGLTPQEFKDSGEWALETNKQLKQTLGMTIVDINAMQSKLSAYEEAEKEHRLIWLPKCLKCGLINAAGHHKECHRCGATLSE